MSGAGPTSEPDIMKKDFRDKPFRTMVALGESYVRGACATRESRTWVRLVADLISDYQGVPVTLHNKGVGGNVISRSSPGYDPVNNPGSAPSAVERYREDVIALNPDLVILSHGFNDMRAGMDPEAFGTDLREIVCEVKKACRPVVVLTTVYYMTDYSLYPPYNRGSVERSDAFNAVIQRLAEENECILADTWAAQGKADWVVHPDTVHANDLGHQLIANRVFEAIAQNCSGVAARITAELAEERSRAAAAMNDLKTRSNCYPFHYARKAD